MIRLLSGQTYTSIVCLPQPVGWEAIHFAPIRSARYWAGNLPIVTNSLADETLSTQRHKSFANAIESSRLARLFQFGDLKGQN